MEFKSIDDILMFAIEKEIEAAEFYEEAAENIQLKGAKAVLLDYAAEERRHEEILKNVQGNKELIENYKFEKIQNIKRSDYLIEMEYRPDMDYLDLIRLAMKREEKSNRLYESLSQSTDDAEHAKLFNILAQEELKHKNALETMYDDYMSKLDD